MDEHGKYNIVELKVCDPISGKYTFNYPRASFKILIHHFLHLPIISDE
jgi:hypothetical protein